MVNSRWANGNWIIDNGLAFAGPRGPLGECTLPAIVPLGNNVFLIHGGTHQHESSLESASTFLLNMNVRRVQAVLAPLHD